MNGEVEIFRISGRGERDAISINLAGASTCFASLYSI